MSKESITQHYFECLCDAVQTKLMRISIFAGKEEVPDTCFREIRPKHCTRYDKSFVNCKICQEVDKQETIEAKIKVLENFINQSAEAGSEGLQDDRETGTRE